MPQTYYARVNGDRICVAHDGKRWRQMDNEQCEDCGLDSYHIKFSDDKPSALECCGCGTKYPLKPYDIS